MAIDARNRTLPDWFTRIRTRQLALPRFQRYESWGVAQVTNLFNSILRDLPLGAALVLEIGDKEPFISRTIKGAPTSGERITEHLLDGQQRLTALWRALHNNYEDRTYFLFLTPDDETGLPWYVDSQARWKKSKDTEQRPFWANKPADQWARRAIPLQLCAPGEEARKAFREWSKAAISNTDEREEITDQVQAVQSKFAACNLPYLSLPVGTKPDTALDVFIRMNTSATPLSTYDIVVAQIEAGIGTSLHDLVGDIREGCPAISNYYPPEDLALYAGALLQGRAPINTTYMSAEFGQQLLGNWDLLIDGIQRTAAFLEDERIFDAARLPSDVVVPVLVALWAVAPTGLDAEGRARAIIRKYLWRAFFTNRYEKSTNSRAFVDSSELKALLVNTSGPPPQIFDEGLHPLPQEQELLSAGWPKYKDRLARAVLALALKNGGVDLADGSPVSRTNLGSREYHHLFPDAHLKRAGRKDEEIFRALNCALVTWRTNRSISDKTPEKYLAERQDGVKAEQAVSSEEIKSRLITHLIPYTEMISGDYDKFLNKRAELVMAQMRQVCGAAG